MHSRRGFENPELLRITNPSRLRAKYWLRFGAISSVAVLVGFIFLWLGAIQYAEWRASKMLRSFEHKLGAPIVIDGHSIGMSNARLTDVSIGNGTLAYFHKVLANYRLTPFGDRSAVAEDITVDDFRVRLTPKTLSSLMGMMGKGSHEANSSLSNESSGFEGGTERLPESLTMKNGTIEIKLNPKEKPVMLRNVEIRFSKKNNTAEFKVASIESQVGRIGTDIAGKLVWNNKTGIKLFLSENNQDRAAPWSIKISTNKKKTNAQIAFKVPILPPFLSKYLKDILETRSTTGFSGKIAIGQDKKIPYMIHIGGRISTKDAKIKHPLVAAHSVLLRDTHLAFESIYNTSNRDLYFRKIKLSHPTSSKIRANQPRRFVSLHGKAGITNIGRQAPSRVFLSLKLPKTSCATVKDAMPVGFADEIDQFNLSGTMSASIDIATSLRSFKNTKIKTPALKIDCQIEPKSRRYSLAAFNWEKNGTKKPNAILHKLRRLPYSSVTDLPDFIAKAFVASEDIGFFTHSGLEVKQLAEALKANIIQGKVKRGGSTISQQTAKNLWLHHGRTLSRKASEVLLSQYLEQGLSKKKILEVYLNLIEFGPEVYGIENAAQTYFSKAAGELNLKEVVFLTTLLPAPKVRYKRACQSTLSRNMNNLMASRLDRMHKAGFISASTAHSEKTRSIKFSLKPEFRQEKCLGSPSIARPATSRSKVSRKRKG